MTTIIIAVIGLVIALLYLVFAARMTEIKPLNTGSETGIEEEK